MSLNQIKLSFIGLVFLIFLNSCAGGMPGADAKKFPPNPDERIKKNLEEGRGFRLDNAFKKKGGDFEFASSNELWRASLDILDFMPLLSANYSGGIIITDWFSKNNKDSIKITLRFLTNEVRSDAIDIKIFYKKCNLEMNCTISQQEGNLEKELKKEILKKAAIYKKQTKDKNFKPYQSTDLKD
jgi:hypothetical protein|tara:strand:- start:319 stop:870 length:552 start_codon:yes stop_codon:yes gene_type:complete